MNGISQRKSLPSIYFRFPGRNPTFSINDMSPFGECMGIKRWGKTVKGRHKRALNQTRPLIGVRMSNLRTLI